MVAVAFASMETAGGRYGTADRLWKTPLCALFQTAGWYLDMKATALAVFETSKVPTAVKYGNGANDYLKRGEIWKCRQRLP